MNDRMRRSLFFLVSLACSTQPAPSATHAEAQAVDLAAPAADVVQIPQVGHAILEPPGVRVRFVATDHDLRVSGETLEDRTLAPIIDGRFRSQDLTRVGNETVVASLYETLARVPAGVDAELVIDERMPMHAVAPMLASFRDYRPGARLIVRVGARRGFLPIRVTPTGGGAEAPRAPGGEAVQYTAEIPALAILQSDGTSIRGTPGAGLERVPRTAVGDQDWVAIERELGRRELGELSSLVVAAEPDLPYRELVRLLAIAHPYFPVLDFVHCDRECIELSASRPEP